MRFHAFGTGVYENTHLRGCTQANCDACRVSSNQQYKKRCDMHIQNPACNCHREMCLKHRHLGCQCENIMQQWATACASIDDSLGEVSLYTNPLGVTVQLTSYYRNEVVSYPIYETMVFRTYACGANPVNIGQDVAAMLSLLTTPRPGQIILQPVPNKNPHYLEHLRTRLGCGCDRCRGRTLILPTGESVVCKECAACPPTEKRLVPCIGCGSC
jgi:hypothetical protein